MGSHRARSADDADELDNTARRAGFNTPPGIYLFGDKGEGIRALSENPCALMDQCLAINLSTVVLKVSEASHQTEWPASGMTTNWTPLM